MADFLNSVTQLAYASLTGTTLLPCSLAGARNEANLWELVLAGLNAVPAAGSGAGTTYRWKGQDAASGAGGSLVLEPGLHVTTGSDGAVVVRQPNGTPGTNEIQFYDDGTTGVIKSMHGSSGSTPMVKWLDSGGNDRLHLTCSDLVVGAGVNFQVLSGAAVIKGGSGQPLYLQNSVPLNFDSGTGATAGLKWLASKVLAATDGSSGAGWLQNTAGEASLNSAATNATAALAATNISIAVAAGRSYRIDGHLILSNSTAGEGAQIDFGGGTATATTFDVAALSVGTNTPGTVASTSLTGALNWSSVTGTNRMELRGYLKVNAGGTLILRLAENTHSAGTVTLGAGSWVALRDTVNL